MRRTYPQSVDNAVDFAIIIGASLRLTRLVTTDALGGWWIVDPLVAWATPREKLRKYLDGLECPFCVGFHCTLFVLLSYAAARRSNTLNSWRLVAGALGVNYVTGHIGVRLDLED